MPGSSHLPFPLHDVKLRVRKTKMRMREEMSGGSVGLDGKAGGEGAWKGLVDRSIIERMNALSSTQPGRQAGRQVVGGGGWGRKRKDEKRCDGVKGFPGWIACVLRAGVPARLPPAH